jgi:hypothetical protein
VLEVLVAPAVTISPITSSSTAVAVCGVTLVVTGVAVLIRWPPRNWNW